MKKYELTNLVDIRFLSFRAEVLLSTGGMDLFNQAWFLWFSRVTP